MIIKHGVENEITAYKIKKWPKVNTGKNTCWSSITISIQETSVDVFWECMRGQAYYFQYKGNMYRSSFYIKKEYPNNMNTNGNFDCANYLQEYKIIKE